MSELQERRLKAFAYHSPSPAVQDAMRTIRVAFQNLAVCLDSALPSTGDPARYSALAHTALEECCMWAMKALSHGDPGATQVSP
jgi:hypothetical protein